MSLTPTPRSVAELLAAVDGAQLVRGDASTPVTGVTQDTRRLEAGDLFVAIPGLQHDGMRFVPDALAGGAAAIVAQRPTAGRNEWHGQANDVSALLPASVAPSLPLVLVPNARAALADLSAAFYDHPSAQLRVVGVTGTDGKTSTTHLLSAILEAHGLRTGWLTTVNTRIGAQIRPNTADHTTPEAPLVQRGLADMRQAGVDVAIVETSSHALELDRVRGVEFRVGVFTNLSPEHINFHGSFEAYRAAKQRLFARLPSDGLAVLNADDPSSEAMQAVTRAPVVTYGLERPATVSASDIQLSAVGTSFVLQPNGVTVRSHLIGRFNISNWLAAYAAATFFGATPRDLVAAAATQLPVPGRMNLVDQGQPFAVIVDFAHTPQALEKALDVIRSLMHGRILLVFGLAGGRDAAHRPVMGALAARKTDFFVISMDDPGVEDAGTIAEAIARGAREGGAGAGQFVVELDRRAAIRLACGRAQAGDAVVLAGKGHEQRMLVGNRRVEWNDARCAGEVLAEMGFESRAVL